MAEITSIKIKDIPTETVLLDLALGKVTNRRIVASDSKSIDTEIDRKVLHVGIDLFDAPELRACINYQQNVKYEIKKYVAPSHFGGGVYLVKVKAIAKVEEILNRAMEGFPAVVEAFAKVVDQRRDEMQEKLKGEFNPALYPSHDEVIEKFRMEWSWFILTTPDALSQISNEFFVREKAKHEQSLKAAAENITALLAAEAKKVGDHLVERLTPDDEGNLKQIRKSAVNNIGEFLESFSFRSIGTSEELNAQMKRIKGLVSGLKVEDLRNNETLRESIKSQFKEVSSALDALIVNKPKRFMAKE
jgi:hypothetical protein